MTQVLDFYAAHAALEEGKIISASDGEVVNITGISVYGTVSHDDFVKLEELEHVARMLLRCEGCVAGHYLVACKNIPNLPVGYVISEEDLLPGEIEEMVDEWPMGGDEADDEEGGPGSLTISKEIYIGALNVFDALIARAPNQEARDWLQKERDELVEDFGA